MTSLTFLKRKIFFLLASSLFLTTSCDDADCEESLPLSSIDIRILLEDKATKISLIGELGQRYDPDEEINVLNASMESVDMVIIGDVISFVMAIDGTQVGDTIRSTYFLDLPPWEETPRRDLDTMYFEHVIIAKDDECDPLDIGQLNYYYNDDLVFSGQYDELPGNRLHTPK